MATNTNNPNPDVTSLLQGIYYQLTQISTGGSGGSVTAAGTNGTVAQAVQGITGGVPVAVKTNSGTPVSTGTFTITTGGTAQTAFAANSIVTQGLIFNPRNATESLFVDLVNSAQNVQGGGTNGTSFEVVPGQLFLCPPSTVLVSVNAATTGHAFVAVRF